MGGKDTMDCLYRMDEQGETFERVKKKKGAKGENSENRVPAISTLP